MSSRLHLGCGKRYIPGWMHIDAVSFAHVDRVHAVDSLPFIEDNSTDVAYVCHILEHFHRDEVPRVLAEWRRVLKPGGILRVAVPDFEALVVLYERTHDLSLIHGPLFGRGDYLYNIHFAVYDFATLERVLTTAGFTNVHRYDRWATDHADVDDYSAAYHPFLDRNGLLLSLNVEATK